MPLDMSGPNSIIAAFMAGQRLKFQRDRAAQQDIQKQQELQEQQRQHDMMQKRFDAELKNRENEFTAKQQVDKAQLELAIANSRMQIAQQMGTMMAPDDAAEEDTQRMNFGPALGNEMRVLTPEAMARRAKPIANLKKDTAVQQANEIAAGGVQPAIDKAKGIGEVTLPVQKQLIDAKTIAKMSELEVAATLRHANAMQEIQLRERLRKNTALDIAAVKNKYKLDSDQLDQAQFDAVSQGVKEGRLSFEDLVKGQKQGPRQVLVGKLAQEGYYPVRDTERRDIAALSTMNAMYRDAEELNKAIKAGNYTEAMVLKQSFIAKRGTLASVLGGQKGAISERDVQAMDAYMQNIIVDPKVPFAKSKANDLRVKQLGKDIATKQNAILSRFKFPQQRTLIKAYDMIDFDEDRGPAQKIGDQ